MTESLESIVADAQRVGAAKLWEDQSAGVDVGPLSEQDQATFDRYLNLFVAAHGAASEHATARLAGLDPEEAAARNAEVLRELAAEEKHARRRYRLNMVTYWVSAFAVGFFAHSIITSFQ